MSAAEKRRRAKVWAAAVRALFSPVGQNDQRAWCACYVRSLADYWSVDAFAVSGATFPTAKIPLACLPGFSLSLDLSEWGNSPPRSSFHMLFEDVQFLGFHIDQSYEASPALLDWPGGNIPGEYHNPASRAGDLLTDAQWVLDRLIMHPCAHVHLLGDMLGVLGEEQNAFRETVHEARLDFGATNPFVALFQFRVQFLLGDTNEETKARKLAERNRVAALLRDAILAGNGPQVVPPGDLFGLRR